MDVIAVVSPSFSENDMLSFSLILMLYSPIIDVRCDIHISHKEIRKIFHHFRHFHDSSHKFYHRHGFIYIDKTVELSVGDVYFSLEKEFFLTIIKVAKELKTSQHKGRIFSDLSFEILASRFYDQF